MCKVAEALSRIVEPRRRRRIMYLELSDGLFVYDVV
jgi:hypothetical protein